MAKSNTLITASVHHLFDIYAEVAVFVMKEHHNLTIPFENNQLNVEQHFFLSQPSESCTYA